MRNRFLILLAFVALPGLARASEVWRDKPVEEWSREETQEFFRHSPWVHQIIVTQHHRVARPASYPTSTADSQRKSSSAEGIKVEPQFGANGIPVETAYYVEWSSAKIVRRAGAHYRALQGKGGEDREPPALDTYFVTVSGYDLTAFDGHDATALKDAAYLRPGDSKDRIRPNKTEVLRGEDGRVIAVRYGFPIEEDGQPLISKDEECVTFVCKARHLKLKTRFKSAEMVVGKGHDLL